MGGNQISHGTHTKPSITSHEQPVETLGYIYPITTTARLPFGIVAPTKSNNNPNQNFPLQVLDALIPLLSTGPLRRHGINHVHDLLRDSKPKNLQNLIKECSIPL